MRRSSRGALVSQYLEGISRTALAEYQQFFREQARRRNGVYALYRKKKLYYVGLAAGTNWSQIGWRVDTHGDREIIWKDGATAGYASFIGYDPVSASAVVVLSNSHNPVDDLGMHLLDSRQPLSVPYGWPPEAKGTPGTLVRHPDPRLREGCTSFRLRDGVRRQPARYLHLGSAVCGFTFSPSAT